MCPTRRIPNVGFWPDREARSAGSKRPEADIRVEDLRPGSWQHAFAANAVFGRRSDLWCHCTDEGRSPRWREISMLDRIASIDDRSGALGRGLVAKFGPEWLCHATAGRTAADAGTGASRDHGSRADVPVL